MFGEKFKKILEVIHMSVKIKIFHTGKVFVSPALPFKDKIKNPNPFQLSLLSSYGRKNRIWLPVSAYLVEIKNLKILIDTGWHREISPNGKYDRLAQVKHLGVGHFLINQGVLPLGESITEQLEKIKIFPKDLDFVIMTHLHSDHASGLKSVKDAKKILVSREEFEDTKKFPIRYIKSMWDGINFSIFDFENTGAGPFGKSFDLLGDNSIELIKISGHTNGLTAVKINCGEKFVLLFSDGGYAKKSWQEMILPGTSLNEEEAKKSLEWIKKMRLDKNCVESIANHDSEVVPHEIIF